MSCRVNLKMGKTDDRIFEDLLVKLLIELGKHNLFQLLQLYAIGSFTALQMSSTVTGTYSAGRMSSRCVVNGSPSRDIVI